MPKNASKETIQLLLESSIKAIFFNVFLSFLLTLDLLSQKIPPSLVLSWFLAIVIVSCLRIIFCKQILSTCIQENENPNLNVFLLLIFITGILWGSAYLIMPPYLNELHEFIIILVFGGITSGAVTSLSTYLPAYYAYTFPIFLPVIVINFSYLTPERIILGLMFLLYLIMILISARINNRLISKIIELATENKSLIDRLTLMSITDPLTGLFNKRCLEETLSKGIRIAKRHHDVMSLVYIDIDNFKLLNDNFGHPYGDEFLIQFSLLLKKIIHRATDTLFRIGGDEFAIVFSNLSSNETLQICEKIKERFQFDLRSKKDPQQTDVLNKITLSMGVLCIHPQVQISLQEIISSADEALYQAKMSGKNKIIFKERVA